MHAKLLTFHGENRRRERCNQNGFDLTAKQKFLSFRHHEMRPKLDRSCSDLRSDQGGPQFVDGLAQRG
jgi:hypothetical protein